MDIKRLTLIFISVHYKTLIIKFNIIVSSWILRAAYTTLSVSFALLSRLNFSPVFKIIFVFFLSSRGTEHF
jgi:hypothetical protein